MSVRPKNYIKGTKPTVTISIPPAELVGIDVRIKALGLNRSVYFGILAHNDLLKRGPLSVLPDPQDKYER